ncbi:SirB2 family protein [Colwellia sp. RSH04]|uniref:SirB2 family protein n=1 Tax=Colwellia sp. RSH04 TaxID=2305464 RepID=UPI000E587786|nr:SirB2 family protein [Colwellia sp. RSH04]RHW75432.1 SirB family protein [Colwellia sp. RSH04]
MFKHLHMTLALLSVSLFTLRFIWLLIGSSQLQKKWVKITPHIIDTLLLSVGILMAYQYSMSPFEHLWLGEKLLAVVAYIFTGYFTLKLARNKSMQIIGYLGAMGWIMLIYRLAVTREAMFF